MKSRLLLSSALLALTIAFAFGLGKVRTSTFNHFTFDFPEMPAWTHRDVSKSLDLNDSAYNFIGEFFAHQVKSNLQEEFLFLILDGGNFHHPKICFNVAGNSVEPQDDLYFNLGKRVLKSHALYAGDERSGTLVLYWITMDKKQVDWPEQKLKQIAMTFMQQKKTALMVRMDIPTRKLGLKSAASLASEFLTDLEKHLSKEQADYLLSEAK